MKVSSAWIILLIQITRNIVSTHPVHRPDTEIIHNVQDSHPNDQLFNNNTTRNDEEEIISVRITSSVAVDRGIKNNPPLIADTTLDNEYKSEPVMPSNVAASEKIIVTDLPPDLSGANLEFIKQLNAKKEARALQNLDNPHPLQPNTQYQEDTQEITSSKELAKSIIDIPYQNDQDEEYSDNVPIARSIPFYPKEVANYDEILVKPSNENRSKSKVTAVSFQVVHDPPKQHGEIKENPSIQTDKFDQQVNNPPQYFNEPSKVYSQPAKVYSVPAKIYSVPAKIYSEPAKIYSEPAKIYSEPAKIYSVPAKFYSQPASLHLKDNYDHKEWDSDLSKAAIDKVSPIPKEDDESKKIVDEFVKIEDSNKFEINKPLVINQEEKSQNGTAENNKVGYVVEGKNFRKYRVEERTSDGFIVGEYGVVRNEDGALRGVRYTADGEASPSLIYDGLMKFLQL